MAVGTRSRSRTPRTLAALIAAVLAALVGITPTARAEVSAPLADILDVDFSHGSAAERAQGLSMQAHGDLQFTEDDELARPVLATDGVDDVISYDFSKQWDAVGDGFTLECVFRYDGPVPSPDTLPCSARWGGGFTFYLNGSALGFQMHDGTGYRAVRTPLEAGKWYHAVGVWDGSSIRLYVDGQERGSTTTSDTPQLPNDPRAYRFAVGGGPATNANGFGAAMPGAVAAARVYSDPLDAEQVTQIWQRHLAGPSTTIPEADIVDVDFEGGVVNERAQGLPTRTFAEPVFVQNQAVDAMTMQLDGFESGVRVDISEEWDQIVDGFTVECTFRYDAAIPEPIEALPCSARWGGGFTFHLSGDRLAFQVHNGGYRSAVTQPIESGRWYHAVGVFDGEHATLFLNGERRAQTTAPGTIQLPNTPKAYAFGIGGGPTSAGAIGGFAEATHKHARIYSEPLDRDAVSALARAALGDQDAGVALLASAPAEGGHLHEPVELDVEIANEADA